MQWLQDGRFLSLLVSWSVSIEKFLQLVKNQERLVLILCVWSVDFPTRNVRVCSNVMTSLTAISLEVIIGGTYCRDVKVGADLPPCYCFKGQGSLWWLVWVSRGTDCFEFHHCYTKHLELTLSFLNGSDTSYSSGILMLFSTNNLKPLFVHPNTTQKGCFLWLWPRIVFTVILLSYEGKLCIFSKLCVFSSFSFEFKSSYSGVM